MEKADHYFYVLECSDGTYYAGYTNNLHKRLEAHNSGKGAKYTRAKRPVKLIHREKYETKPEAMRAEYAFKQLTRLQKNRYIEANKEAEQ